jgi:uncharacterized paraquat-inducible protein A
MLVLARGVTVALLVLFPVAWLAPLAEAGFAMPLFGGSEISILGGVIELADSDIFLCIVVAVFAILIPYAKTIILLGAQFGLLGAPAWWLKVLGYMGKLSMADVFLIAMYVVLIKGIGFGKIEIMWGLYLFTALVLVSMWATWVTERALKREAETHG